MMRRWSIHTVFILLAFGGCCEWTLGYDDDDLLCRSGWSPELHQQQVWQQQMQHRANFLQSQYETARAIAAEQRAIEMSKRARQARLDKTRRRRDEIIAKRLSENAGKPVPVVSVRSVSTQSP